MVALLVLGTFLVFILLDWLLSRNKVSQPVMATIKAPARTQPHIDPEHVEGFLVPDKLAYHPGHSWLARERRNLVRVGADEFAAALAGSVDKIELPKPGQWIRQGQKAWTFFRNGEKAEMVSPTEGEVVEVNQELARDPSLVRSDRLSGHGPADGTQGDPAPSSAALGQLGVDVIVSQTVAAIRKARTEKR